VRLNVRSLAILLDDVIGDSENDIIESLLECKKRYNKHFNVIFIHRNLNRMQIKEFVSRHSNELIKIESEITKDKVRYVWFNINLTNDDIMSWRYNYRGGNIQNGIKSYIEILNHIEKKEGSR
tara:strand:- start:124 stop:492 length:369 start_codon:yes stop_codon:yes gene_type:complete